MCVAIRIYEVFIDIVDVSCVSVDVDNEDVSDGAEQSSNGRKKLLLQDKMLHCVSTDGPDDRYDSYIK